MHLANKGKTPAQFSIIHSWRDLKQPTLTEEGKWKNVVPWHFLNKHKSASSTAIKLFGGNINSGLFLTHYNPESNPALIFCCNFSCTTPDSRSSWVSAGFIQERYQGQGLHFPLLVEGSSIISTFFSTPLSLQRGPFLLREKYHFFSRSFPSEK